ncbi:uncharacterized protein LOC110841857 [Folsomia candida]|uniref:uncharacterized protein LOC110841857 n=1 Tax=Folsomia candida TaxID=158441 RepID=UPI001604C384|nr:uncharacterized protein LOC110841857 [Folsomia candida]
MKIKIIVTYLSVLFQINPVIGDEQEKYPKSQSFTPSEVDEMVAQIFETLKPSDFDNGAGPGVGIDLEEEKIKFKKQWSRENKNVGDKLKGLELVLKNIKLKHADLENSESFSFAENLEFLLDCNKRAKELLNEATKIGAVFDFEKGEKLQQDFSKAIGIHTAFNSAITKTLEDFESNKFPKEEMLSKVYEIRGKYPEVFDITKNDDFAERMASSIKNVNEVDDAMKKAAELL